MMTETIETHSEYCNGKQLPAINIKVYKMPNVTNLFPSISKEQSEKTENFCFNQACHDFWFSVESMAESVFGENIDIYQAGRSGGWLVVDGLPEITEWDDEMISKWGHFKELVKTEIDYQMSSEVWESNILSNRWDEEGAENFNFFDDENGNTICISEMKKRAIEAGFGPVVR